METELTPQSSLESRSVLAEIGSGNSESLFKMIEQSFLDSHPLDVKLAEIEQAIITVALIKTNWNKAEASRLCGMNRTTLVEKCRRYGMLNVPMEEATG